MGTFNFDIKGLYQLQKRLNAVPVKVKREVGAEILDGARRINGKQLRLVPVDEGGLKQATGYKKTNDLKTELIANKQNAPFMEFGTKKKVRIPPELQDFAKQFNLKGPQIGFDAFFNIILDWVHRKGIAGRFSIKTKRRVGSKAKQLEEDFDTAWPIALNILKNGVNPHPFFFQPFFEEREQIIKNVEKVLKDI
jgi:hypothetical protein